VFSEAVLSALTTYGGIYYHISSELRSSSVSTHRCVPRFQVPLKEGMRLVPEPEPVPAVVSDEPTKDTEQVNTEVEGANAPTTELTGYECKLTVHLNNDLRPRV